MTHNPQCHALADRIRQIFRDGFFVTADMIQFMESLCPVSPAEGFERWFADPEDIETASFLEYIFTPDDAIQDRLEDHLWQGSYRKSDESEVVEMLTRHPQKSPVRFEGYQQTIWVHIPPDCIQRFVLLLRITHRLDPELDHAIRQNLDRRKQRTARICFRNAKYMSTARITPFLCKLLECLADEKDDCIVCLQFALEALEEINPDADLYSEFMGLKRRHFKRCLQADKHMSLLAEHNVETLLSQGVRMPHIDRNVEAKKMDMIDRICLAVFGKTENPFTFH